MAHAGGGEKFTTITALQRLFPDGKMLDATHYCSYAISSSCRGEIYKILLSARYNEGKTIKHILVLASDASYGTCGACGAPIMVAVFVKSPPEWILETRIDEFDNVGASGYPPSESRLARVGPQKYGFVLEEWFSAQSGDFKSLHLYASVRDSIQKVLMLPDIQIYQEVEISRNGVTVWGHIRHKSFYSFVEGANPEYFSLRVETYGIGLNADFMEEATGFSTIAKTIIYSFNGEAYVAP